MAHRLFNLAERMPERWRNVIAAVGMPLVSVALVATVFSLYRP